MTNQQEREQADKPQVKEALGQVLAILERMGIPMPVLVAAAILLLIGFVWGIQENRRLIRECDAGRPSACAQLGRGR